jgi:hypothetical protein
MTTKLPSIPSFNGENVGEVLTALTEATQVRVGVRGDSLDAGVTFRDLAEIGLVQEGSSTGAGSIQGLSAKVNLKLPDGEISPVYDGTSDLTTPPAPTDLKAVAVFDTVFLSWNVARFANPSYYEIFRAFDNDLSAAQLAGTSTSQSFTDIIGENRTLYYWVRTVSQAGVRSAWNSALGTEVKTGVDPAKIIPALQGQVLESSLSKALATRIADTFEQTADLVETYGSTMSAAQSAANAAASQAAAIAAKAAALLAQTGAETARDAAVVAKTSAETSAANASTSETAASQSATGAAGSASSAATSATAAANSANAAGGSATAAATSASSAATYATNAETASTASNSAKVSAESARDAAQNVVLKYRVDAFGLSATTQGAQSGIRNGKTNAVLYSPGRSWNLLVLNRSDGAVASHATYDVYGGSAQATALANALNALNDTKAVVVYTYDEPQNNAYNNTALKSALKRCGATEATLSGIKYRSAYILAGIPGVGEGGGVEKYAGAVDSDANAWVYYTLQVLGGEPVNVFTNVAEQKASAAATSASTASTKANEASQSASAAATSATNASTSAANAATSASQASTSETNAAGSSATAATAATNAANSATAAGNSATAASNSASTASTKATDAETSATAANTSKVAAETAATNAASSASAAATSASTAATKATEAGASATTATTQATNASTSAAQAGTYATNASSSATSASGSATAAATSLSQVQATIRGTSLGLPLEQWVLNGQSIVTINDGKVGTKALRLSGISGAYPNQGNYVAIDASRKYQVRFWARPSSNASGGLYFSLRQFLNDSGSAGPDNGGRSPYKPSNQSRASHIATYGDTWGEYSYTWSSSDWQTGVKFVQPEFLDNYSGGAGYWEVQGFAFTDVTETIAVQTQANATASTVTGLSAQYTVKIDNSGYVTGFGLASETVNGTPFSQFSVRADRFSITNPAASRKTLVGHYSPQFGTSSFQTSEAHGFVAGDKVSFINLGVTDVFTVTSVPSATTFTTAYVGAVTVYAFGPFSYVGKASVPFIVDGGKVYIDTAVIKDADITDAKIGSVAAKKITAGYINASIAINGAKVYGSELYSGGTTGVTTDANGNVTAFTANNPTVKIAGGNAEFVVNNFKVMHLVNNAFQTTTPFEVDGDVVRIKTALIGDGTIGSAKIAETIESTNYATSATGWQLTKAGAFNLKNGTITAGLIKSVDEKMKIDLTNGFIRIEA